MRRFILTAGGVLAIWLILEGSGVCQTGVNGSISGTVSDQSGAVVPGASVKLTNTATNVSRQATSNDAGYYEFPLVSPGTYDITVTLEGFATITKQGVVLLINQPATVDFELKPGAVTEELSVSAATPLVNSVDSTIGTVVDTQQAVNLPLNGRQFSRLILLAPGVAPRGGSQQARYQAQSDLGQISPSVNGARNDSNNFTMDGVENNELMFNSAAISPPPDAIQEFKVQNFISSGAFGRAPGANVNVVTRSGTNEIHGNAWEFLRNDKLDARNFFAAERPAFRQNQFGGTLGAPIIKDKFWAFGYYEGFRKSLGTTGLAVVPSAAQLDGDLSSLPVQIYNPFTTRAVGTDSDGNPIFARDPFPNNQIPANLLNRTAVELAKAIYLPPNLANAAAGESNFINTQPIVSNFNQWSVRGDTVLPSDWRLFSRVTRFKGNKSTPPNVPENPERADATNLQAVLGLTKSFSSTTLVDFHIQYLRTNQADFRQPLPTDFLESIGLLKDFPAQKNLLPSEPGVTISDFDGWPGNTQFPFFIQNWEYNGSITKIIGKHTITGGASLFRSSMFSDFGYGGADFNNLPTADPQNLASTGSGLASYLLGLPGGASREAGDGGQTIKGNIYSGWVNDQIKATRNLTLTLGLRYDNAPAMKDYRGRSGAPNWDLSSAGHVVYLVDENALKYPSQILTPDHTLKPDVPPFEVRTGKPGLVDYSQKNFGPRVGIAYRLPHDLVLRSGYAIFYEFNQSLFQSQNGNTGQWPFGFPDFTPSGLNIPSAENPLPTGILGSGTLFPPLSLSYQPPLGTAFAVESHTQYPYVQQWNLGIQKELPGNWALSIDYLGTKGTHMGGRFAVNTAVPGVTPIETRRRIPDIGILRLDPHWFNSSYNAATVKLEHRGRELTTILGYAYSHSIDEISCTHGDCGKTQNFLDFRASRGNSDYDITHNFVASWVYQLPFGRGRRYLSGTGGLANALIGGWQVMGITMLQTGMPFNIFISQDNANVGITQQRPSVTSLDALRLSSSEQTPNRWFNTDALYVSPFGTFGNLGRNVLRRDGVVQIDFGLAKVVPIHERANIEFRAEFFNLPNHANFGDPVNFLGRGNFGQVTSYAPGFTPRDIQFGLKVNF